MVRYSITMDDGLVSRIDEARQYAAMSRSDWINQAYTIHLQDCPGIPACMETPAQKKPLI